MKLQAIRYHDICAGHRVCGHESKCQHLHGHNYRVYFYCDGDLDSLGRVIDFSVIKEKLCMWLEEVYDHHFLVWKNDPIAQHLLAIDNTVVLTDFNPTAENIAKHLVEVVAPKQLLGTGVVCSKIVIEETRKCSASYTI